MIGLRLNDPRYYWEIHGIHRHVRQRFNCSLTIRDGHSHRLKHFAVEWQSVGKFDVRALQENTALLAFA